MNNELRTLPPSTTATIRNPCKAMFTHSHTKVFYSILFSPTLTMGWREQEKKKKKHDTKEQAITHKER